MTLDGSTEGRSSAATEGMDEWTVIVARPEKESLSGLDRAERLRVLEENSARQRENLVAWLAEEGLADQVASISEPTVFNMLFVVATPFAAKRLEDAPGVTSVSQAGELRVDLLGQSGNVPGSE